MKNVIKILSWEIAIVVIILLLNGCSDNNLTPSGTKHKTESDTAIGIYQYYTVYVNIKPHESIHLTGAEVGFNAWRIVNIVSDETIELRVNNQETILEMKSLQVDGVRWENIEVLNHTDEINNVTIEILGLDN